MEEGGECPTLILSIHNMRNVRAIDYDPLQEMVYWVEGRGHTIRRAHHNGSHGQLFVSNDMEKIYPYDLALDPFSRLLVWSCARSNVINATRLDRTQVCVCVCAYVYVCVLVAISFYFWFLFLFVFIVFVNFMFRYSFVCLSFL